MASSGLTVKVVVAGSDDIRRIPLSSSTPCFDQLVLMVRAVLQPQLAADEPFVLKYTDEEGDQISVASQTELDEAVRFVAEQRLPSLKLFLFRGQQASAPALPAATVACSRAELINEEPDHKQSDQAQADLQTELAASDADNTDEHKNDLSPALSSSESDTWELVEDISALEIAETTEKNDNDSTAAPDSACASVSADSASEPQQVDDNIDASTAVCAVHTDDEKSAQQQQQPSAAAPQRTTSPRSYCTVSSGADDTAYTRQVYGRGAFAVGEDVHDSAQFSPHGDAHQDYASVVPTNSLKRNSGPYVLADFKASEEGTRRSRSNSSNSNSGEDDAPCYSSPKVHRLPLAAFVRHLLHKNEQVEVDMPQTRFKKGWAVRNNGITDWPAGCQLVFLEGTPLHTASTAAASSNEVPPLKPFSEHEVFINMVAPAASGRHSAVYSLATADGRPFGCRLPVSVVVGPTTEELQAQAQSQRAPTPSTANSATDSSSSGPSWAGVVRSSLPSSSETDNKAVDTDSASLAAKLTPTQSHYLAVMFDMGFRDRDRNLAALRKHNNDLPKAVSELL